MRADRLRRLVQTADKTCGPTSMTIQPDNRSQWGMSVTPYPSAMGQEICNFFANISAFVAR